MSSRPTSSRYSLPDSGVLFVVTGPSGVGKSTLIARAMDTIPGLAFSVSATTRPPRVGERDGVDYHFLTEAVFRKHEENGEFLESATVYDRSYGTLMGPTSQALQSGRSLLLDIDVQGARAVRSRLPESVLLYLLPPDIETLETRLRGRGTDPPEVARARMDQVEEQLRGCGEFDYLVVNDDLETAHRAFEAVILAEMSRRSRRQSWVDRVDRQLVERRG